MNTILPKNYSEDFKHVLEQQPYNTYRESLPIIKYTNCFFTYSGIGLKYFKLIPETLFANISKKHIGHFYKYAIYKYFAGKNISIRGADLLILHNHWSKGYHHWITEVLTKITLINPAEYRLIIPQEYKRFAFDGLSLYKFKEIIKLPNNYGLKVNEVSIIPNPNSGHYNPFLIESLRKQMIEKCDDKCSVEPCDYIYVSRKNAPWRKVLNEDEVMAVLSKYGFKMVEIEQLNFYQQVMLFSKCKIFVSIHGAALTNAVFMPKGSKVLELYRSLKDGYLWMNPCYWNLCTVSGLDYFYQFCEHTNDLPSIDNSDIIVDILKLEENIKLMLG